jgi:hypothetical protein
VKGQSAWCCPNVHEEWTKIAKLGHMGHVREYTPRDVTEFLWRVGFRPEVTVHRGDVRRASTGCSAAFARTCCPS